jgi:hypothetical protein
MEVSTDLFNKNRKEKKEQSDTRMSNRSESKGGINGEAVTLARLVRIEKNQSA